MALSSAINMKIDKLFKKKNNKDSDSSKNAHKKKQDNNEEIINTQESKDSKKEENLSPEELKQKKEEEAKAKQFFNNWYDDRYHIAIVQRNILLILLTISFITIISAIFVVMYINSSHKIEPFVIEVDKNTGVATLVDTSDIKRFSANRAINNYFLVKYINARELFDPNNYIYNWYTLIRLMSSGEVHRRFLSTANSEESASGINTSNAKLKIRSIQYLGENSVQIRFAIDFESIGKLSKVFSKVALITFEYKDEMLTIEQRYINPLGFYITSYRVTDEFEQ